MYNYYAKTYGELIDRADNINDLNSKDEILEVFDEILVRLRDARNDYCEDCGRYKEAHNGACGKCYWRD